MKVESLKELESAFTTWRRAKKHVREAVPEALLVRARRATERHGVAAVARATRIDGPRLFRTRQSPASRGRERTTGGGGSSASSGRKPTPRLSAPTFTRLELSAPAGDTPAARRPLAEVRTPGGAKLVVFEDSARLMTLLSEVCGVGGAR